MQAQPVFFNHITQEDGLRNGNVRAITKDFQGFVWIGTEDGLHRYDGNQMKIYRKRESDSTSISSNFILCLYEDKAHNLWVGTLDGGLCMYDRENDIFIRYSFSAEGKASSNFAVRSILQAADGYLYVGSDNLMRARVGDPASMQFERVVLFNDPTKTSERVSSIVAQDDSTLLVAVNTQGLFVYNIRTGRSTRHAISDLVPEIQTLFLDNRRNLIWAGTWRDGLFVFDPVSKKYRWFKPDKDGSIFKSNFIADLAGDSDGNLWIGTDDGLILVPYDCDPWHPANMRAFSQGQQDRSGIQGSIVKAIHIDETDLVWVGMYYEGINVYDRNAMNFGSLPIQIGEASSSKYGNINAVQADKNDNLWIGLDGGGLYYLNGKLGSGSTSLEALKTCQSVDKIKSLKIDKDGNVWIGTWGNGLTFINARTQACTELVELNTQIGKEVLSLDVDNDNNLLIGTFDRGLFRYSIKEQRATRIQNSDGSKDPMDRVNTILVDNDNGVWIGREAGGLAYLGAGEDSYHHIDTTHLNSRTTVLSSYMDKEGILWMGVASLGLVRYDPKTNSSQLFGEEAGLINSYAQAIEEDDLERLWISHNMGLSVFYKQNHTFSNFSRSNGLLASQYNRNAAVRMSDGRLAFGNIRGLNFFDPARFRKEEKKIPVVFTKFLVDNIEQTSGSRALPQNITGIEKIELEHNQNSIGIEFASLEYDFAQFREYNYMLEGYDNDWKRTDNTRRLIAYTNLEPGEYTFKVRIAKNSDELVSGSKEIKIEIIPAWWQTIWFKVAAVVMTTLIIWGVFRIRMRFLFEQRRQLAQKVQERTIELNGLNTLLQAQIEEINSMNSMLQIQQQQIVEKNNEIQAQNEELTSQNEQIVQQHDGLIEAQRQLKDINLSLEQIVDERTRELQRTIKDLNKTVFELDRFVYSASHDLSAPLKSIRGLVELIKMEKDTNAVYRYTTHIKDTALKLEAVIRSMVDYARNTHVLVKVEQFHLKELIDEVISELSFWPEASRIEYQNRIPDDFVVVTDKHRIKIVLLNLVTNGIKYSDRNKSSSWMKFECMSFANEVQLKVSDNGIGIQKEYIDNIFKMYFRATESSKGSGLGLFIVSEVLDKIGGNISVQSEYGEHTTFELVIPNKAQSA